MPQYYSRYSFNFYIFQSGFLMLGEITHLLLGKTNII